MIRVAPKREEKVIKGAVGSLWKGFLFEKVGEGKAVLSVSKNRSVCLKCVFVLLFF